MLYEKNIERLELFSKYARIPSVILRDNEIVYTSMRIDHINQITIYPKIESLNLSRDTVTILTYNVIECYGIFYFDFKGKEHIVIIGPVLSFIPQEKSFFSNLSFYERYGKEQTERLVKLIPQMNIYQFANYLSLLYKDFMDVSTKPEELVERKTTVVSSTNLYYEPAMVKNIVSSNSTYMFSDILKYAEPMQTGNLIEVNALLKSEHLFEFFDEDRSKINLHHFIAMTSILAMYAEKKGLDPKYVSSFCATLFDYAESISSREEFIYLFTNMVKGFTYQIQQAFYNNNYSDTVKKTILFIERHIHEPLDLVQISSHVRISKQYLSQTFSKEYGKPIQMFVQEKKMEEAENLLRYSSMSIAEIASALSYCTQSYFTEVFKKNHGITPVQYRKSTKSLLE